MKTNTSLGSLENKIMDILWTNEKMSTSEITKEVNKNKKHAYTTIATILDRLHCKNLVKRRKVKGKYLYSVKLSKKNYYNNVAKNFITGFVESYGDNALASFAESIDELPPKKRKQLLELLNTQKK